MDQERKVYLYGLIDPESRSLIYVGQSHDPDQRMKSHFYSTPWMLNRETAPEMVIFGSTVESNAAEAERQLISTVLSITNDLRNEDKSPRTPARGPRDRPNKVRAGSSRQWSNTQGIDPSILIEFRGRTGMSQAETARALGVHYSAVSLWESGKRRIPKHIELALKSIPIPDQKA